MPKYGSGNCQSFCANACMPHGQARSSVAAALAHALVMADILN